MAFGYSDRSGTPKPYDATAWTRGVHPDRPLPQAAPVYDAAPTRPAPALAPSALTLATPAPPTRPAQPMPAPAAALPVLASAPAVTTLVAPAVAAEPVASAIDLRKIGLALLVLWILSQFAKSRAKE